MDTNSLRYAMKFGTEIARFTLLQGLVWGTHVTLIVVDDDFGTEYTVINWTVGARGVLQTEDLDEALEVYAAQIAETETWWADKWDRRAS